MDITENKIFEAFGHAAKGVYMFLHDVEKDLTVWSPNARRYYGLPDKPMRGLAEEWGSRIHPNDREAYENGLSALFSGQAQYFDMRARIMNGVGEYSWVEGRGTMIQDDEGAGRKIFCGMLTRLDARNTFDPVTKLYAAHEFFNRVLDPRGGVLLMLGIDNFREILEQRGYSFGNYVISNVAQLLSERVEGETVIYRFLGDCFLIDMKNTTESQACDMFRRLSLKNCEIVHPSGQIVMVTCTGAGVAYPKDGRIKDELIAKLENALRVSKKRERGGLQLYTNEISEQNRRQAFLRAELTKSIKDNFKGFELNFQPIVDSRTRKTFACESLLRWHYTDSSGREVNVSPVEFIPLLEMTGEINTVGRFVARKAMSLSRLWNKKYGKIRVGFNVSYRQFQQLDFVDSILKDSAEQGVEPTDVVIELTESCKVDDIKTLGNDICLLEKRGFSVSLDDFGMEYSTLDLLREMMRMNVPIGSVKIDHTFVRELAEGKNEIDKSILESMVNMTKKLNLNVVVEGVENEEVEKLVTDMGANYLQGYLYSRPLSQEAFEERLAKERNIE